MASNTVESSGGVVIQESPAKRRKMDPTTPSRSPRVYDSHDDSADDLFDGYDTIATLPVAKLPPTQMELTQLPSSSMGQTTQPTQILDRSMSRGDSGPRKPSIVQVAASSPLRPPPTPMIPPSVKPTATRGGFASSMAPAGTAFRPPLGIQRAPPKPAVIDLSDDDGPIYKGRSSDDELSMPTKADIKPSTFARSGKAGFGGNGSRASLGDSPPRLGNRFKEITAGALYKPSGKAPGFDSNDY